MDTKLIRLTGAKATSDGTLSGYAARFGNVDLVGERIVNGAFTATLPQFRDRGFLTHNHTPEPIGWIEHAAEDPHGLYVTARFHGDPPSQSVRQRVTERLAADKFVGMSIGYLVKPGGRRYADDGVVELTDLELLEAAIAWIPANPQAAVASAKAGALALAPTDATVDLDRAFKARALLEQAAEYGAARALQKALQRAELLRIRRRYLGY